MVGVRKGGLDTPAGMLLLTLYSYKECKVTVALFSFFFIANPKNWSLPFKIRIIIANNMVEINNWFKDRNNMKYKNIVTYWKKKHCPENGPNVHFQCFAPKT